MWAETWLWEGEGQVPIWGTAARQGALCQCQEAGRPLAPPPAEPVRLEGVSRAGRGERGVRLEGGVGLKGLVYQTEDTGFSLTNGSEQGSDVI